MKKEELLTKLRYFEIQSESSICLRQVKKDEEESIVADIGGRSVSFIFEEDCLHKIKWESFKSEVQFKGETFMFLTDNDSGIIIGDPRKTILFRKDATIIQ